MKAITLIAALLLLALVAGAAFVWSGLYDISATDQHLPPTYAVIRKTMERSVARRADDITVPELGTPAQLERGLAIFRRHCVQCHGAPGVSPEPFALALRPLPTPLMFSGRDRPPGYLYWVVQQGLKMTAMPAWEFRMPDEDLWAVVAFLKKLPTLSPREYEALEAPELKAEETAATGAPDAGRGKRALHQYACITCHEIPGVTGAEVGVGPPLHGIGSRRMLGGVLPNSPENMALWIRFPRRFAPGSAMPDLGVSARDARDIAAYLGTL